MKSGRTPCSRATPAGFVRSLRVTMNRPVTAGLPAAAATAGSVPELVEVGGSLQAARAIAARARATTFLCIHLCSFGPEELGGTGRQLVCGLTAKGQEGETDCPGNWFPAGVASSLPGSLDRCCNRVYPSRHTKAHPERIRACQRSTLRIAGSPKRRSEGPLLKEGAPWYVSHRSFRSPSL